jgi:hypothetical protein
VKLIEFDSRTFCDDIADIISQRGHGARQKCLKKTGIASATFNRMLNRQPVRDIDTILAAAAYFELPLKKYVLYG